MMEVHAKVTQLELPSERDDLSFRIRTKNTSFTFIRFVKISLGPPGPALLLLRFPNFHLPNNRAQRISAHGRIRLLKDLDTPWKLKTPHNPHRVSKYLP